VTRAGDALAACADAYGRIADDVLALARPEIGELREPAALVHGQHRGGSSAMPDKTNPVLATLMRRAALTAPALAGQLHLAAAEVVDERPSGSWHVEWQTLQLLGRRTLVAASQATELLAGLHVDADRMRATLQAAADAVLAERRSLAALADLPARGDQGIHDRRGPAASADPATYLGATDALIDATLDRAGAYLKGRP
jgi:3-carboxy-cis,cis-muconate cycloisomerase